MSLKNGKLSEALRANVAAERPFPGVNSKVLLEFAEYSKLSEQISQLKRPQSPPAKLDSDKFGDEAARPNRWLD